MRCFLPQPSLTLNLQHLVEQDFGHIQLDGISPREDLSREDLWLWTQNKKWTVMRVGNGEVGSGSCKLRYRWHFGMKYWFLNIQITYLYVSQIITLKIIITLNLHSGMCQLYLNKDCTSRKKYTEIHRVFQNPSLKSWAVRGESFEPRHRNRTNQEWKLSSGHVALEVTWAEKRGNQDFTVPSVASR